MVKVTERAMDALKSALSRSAEEPGTGLRVEVSEEGSCTLFPDRKKPGDQVVEHQGDVLLLIGEEASEPLEGATIDIAEMPDGPHLVVSKPHLPEDGVGGTPA